MLPLEAEDADPPAVAAQAEPSRHCLTKLSPSVVVFCAAGVSLCEAEASVAAPMTSKQQSITSMISVVAEGRCALLATYQIFQFIVGYAMAQAFATNLMYTHALQMGNYQYLIGVSAFPLVCFPSVQGPKQQPVACVLSQAVLVAGHIGKTCGAFTAQYANK